MFHQFVSKIKPHNTEKKKKKTIHAVLNVKALTEIWGGWDRRKLEKKQVFTNELIDNVVQPKGWLSAVFWISGV